MNVDLQKNWWIVPSAAGIVTVAALIIAEQLAAALEDAVMIVGLALIGVSFLWAFFARGVFWAVAPGVGCLTVALLGLLSGILPENNGWIGTFVLGAASVLIGAIPNPREEMKVCYLIGVFIIAIGTLMVPLAFAWRLVLLIGTVLVTGFVLWRNPDYWKSLGAA